MSVILLGSNTNLRRVVFPNWTTRDDFGSLDIYFGFRHLFEMIEADKRWLLLNNLNIETINIKLKSSIKQGERIDL